MRRDLIKALKRIGEAKLLPRADGALNLTAVGQEDFTVPAPAIAAMVAEGLLERGRDSSVKRTAAGRAFLRRALASGADEPFLAQHRTPVLRSVEVGEDRQTVVANASESPLAWLAARKGKNGDALISTVQRNAGERLASDHERGHHRDKVTQSWDASCVRGPSRRDGLSVTEASVAARARVEKALDAVGPGLADILVAVCCEEVGLETAEKRLGWPARSGKVVLKLALDRLAEHYGLGAAVTGCGRGLVHWGGPGYRPAA
ncbi:MAG: DUF6456 domain-containing protein [Pseudomonadota bacterium]